MMNKVPIIPPLPLIGVIDTNPFLTSLGETLLGLLLKEMTERVQHKDVRKLERNVNHQHNPPMAINRTIEISYKTPLL